MDKTELAVSRFGPIHDRIGPIFDSAYLKLIDEEQIRQITLITAKAELAIAQQHAKAMEEVVKIVEVTKVKVAGR